MENAVSIYGEKFGPTESIMPHKDKNMSRHLPVSIRMIGAYRRRRYLVTVDNVEIYLPLRLYRYMFLLAVAALARSDGYLLKRDIDNSPVVDQYVHKLKDELRQHLGHRWVNPIMTQKRKRRLKLNIMPTTKIGIDLDINVGVPDEYVKKTSMRLARAARR